MPFVILKKPRWDSFSEESEKKKIYIYIVMKIVSLKSNYFIFISRLTPLYRIPIKKNIKLHITIELGKWIF